MYKLIIFELILLKYMYKMAVYKEKKTKFQPEMGQMWPIMSQACLACFSGTC